MKRFLFVFLAVTGMSLLRSGWMNAQDTTCGIIWYPPIQISPGITGVDETNASFAVQGDTVHVTWGNSSQRFPYRRSTNGGLSFDPVMELAPDSTPLITNGFVLSSGASVYGFWIDYESVQNTGWMIRSSNYGITWDTPHMIRDSTGFWHFGAASGDTIVLGIIRRVGENRITYHSTNAGLTWSESGTYLIGNNPRIAMTPGITHRVTGWIFDSAGVWSEYVVQYRKSTDLGETWSDSVNLSTMSARAYEPSIAAEGSNGSASVITAWKDSKYGCITLVGCSILGRRSITSGDSFLEEERFDVSPSGVNIYVAVSGSKLAVAWDGDLPPNEPSFVRVSSDNGLSWCPAYSVAFDIKRLDAIAISGNTIHLAFTQKIGGSGGRRRVFYRRGVFLPTDVPEAQIVLPPFAKLLQNYPNPFNPSTRIGFRVSGLGYVSLKVYDILGREVATLLNEKKEAGEHTFEWKAEDAPSGVYYYRLHVRSASGVLIETKKMILMR